MRSPVANVAHRTRLTGRRIAGDAGGMTRIAVLDDYIGVAEEYGDWSALGPDDELTIYREAIDPERLVEELQPYEIVAITQQRTWFPRQVLEGLPELKLIVCNGPTSNVIDHAARTKRGILLCGTADAVSPPASNAPRSGVERAEHRPGIPGPSEMAWALIFAVTKRIGIEDREIRAGGWQKGYPINLAGKTLGLAGLGHLGGAMVPVAKALGMDVLAWSQNLTDERTAQLGVRHVSKEELLRESDVLAIFLVLSERTKGLFGREELALMRPTSFLVNISRGPIVDEDALIQALRTGKLAGAGLDVFGREPLAKDSPLRSLDNVVVIPHLGYATEQGFRTSWRRMSEDITAYLRGTPIRVVDNPAALPSMAYR
jgi:phosphoglycerate dehydrogenase-like enzyme